MSASVRLSAVVAAALTVGLLGPARAADPLRGYADEDDYAKQIEALQSRSGAAVRSLAKSPGGRDVWLVTVGPPKHKDAVKPAMLIVGSTYGPHLLGSELAVRLAHRLAADEPHAKKLREQMNFYILPRLNPDASAAVFDRPRRERATNARATDDDTDGEVNEDDYDDLNNDGLITVMRIADPAGDNRPHPDDPRVMIDVDRRSDETGAWRLELEGRDNDEDDETNEDPVGGVDIDRNFPFDYPYFEQGAGAHAASEPETRAVIDFAYDHPEIAIVFSFGLDDNLHHEWKIEGDDTPYAKFIAQTYRETLEAKGAPPKYASDGSFARWAYHYYGRWSLSARGWWPEPVSLDDLRAMRKRRAAGWSTTGGWFRDDPPIPDALMALAKVEPPKKLTDDRGDDELATLWWCEKHGIDAFVEWKPIDHPDYPDRKVEVGGIKPLVTLNPPADQLDALAAKHAAFLAELAALMPRASIDHVEVKPLGGGVVQLTVRVINEGYLPTRSVMGRKTGDPMPLQLSLDLPKGAELLRGHQHTLLDPIEGRGGATEHTWLLRTGAKEITVKLASPSVGSHTRKVTLR